VQQHRNFESIYDKQLYTLDVKLPRLRYLNYIISAAGNTLGRLHMRTEFAVCACSGGS